MNIKASVRGKCPCCTDEFINVPLDLDDLVVGDDGENPDLQLSLGEAVDLIKKLHQLVNV